MSAAAFDPAAAARDWRPPPLIASPMLRYAVYLGALAYALPVSYTHLTLPTNREV